MKRVKGKSRVILLFLTAAVITLALFSSEGVAVAKDEDDLFDNLSSSTAKAIENLDTDAFQRFLDSLEDEQKSAVPFHDLKEFIKGLTKGETEDFFSNFLTALLKSLGKYFVGFLPSIITILVVSLLKSMLSGMASGF